MAPSKAVTHITAGFSSAFVAQALFLAPFENFKTASHLHEGFSAFRREGLTADDTRRLLTSGIFTDYALYMGRFAIAVGIRAVLAKGLKYVSVDALAAGAASFLTYPLYASRINTINSIVTVAAPHEKVDFRAKNALLVAAHFTALMYLQAFLSNSFRDSFGSTIFQTIGDSASADRIVQALATAAALMALNPLEQYVKLSITLGPSQHMSFIDFIKAKLRTDGLPSLFRGCLWSIPEAVCKTIIQGSVYQIVLRTMQ